MFSYMDGLIPLLDRFVTDPDTVTNVSSVIPGRIYVVKGERFILLRVEVRAFVRDGKKILRASFRSESGGSIINTAWSLFSVVRLLWNVYVYALACESGWLQI